MDSLRTWWAAFEESLSATISSSGAYLPTLGAAITIMIAGWLVARLVRSGLLRGGGMLERALGQLDRPLRVGGLRVSERLIALTARFVFWVIILLFAAAAARVAGLDTFSMWLDRVVDYLPTLIAGLLIAFAGYLIGTLVKDIVSATFISIGAAESEIAGIAAQVGVFVTALVIGLDQIGIDVTFLIAITSVGIAGVSLSVAIAFGTGARDFVSNLIAARQLTGSLTAGDYAKCGDVEGRVLEVTSTMVVLVNDRGKVLVPAGHLQNRTSEILLESADE